MKQTKATLRQNGKEMITVKIDAHLTLEQLTGNLCSALHFDCFTDIETFLSEEVKPLSKQKMLEKVRLQILMNGDEAHWYNTDQMTETEFKQVMKIVATKFGFNDE